MPAISLVLACLLLLVAEAKKQSPQRLAAQERVRTAKAKKRKRDVLLRSMMNATTKKTKKTPSFRHYEVTRPLRFDAAGVTPCSNRFVFIIATGRSGSTSILETLSALPGMRMSSLRQTDLSRNGHASQGIWPLHQALSRIEDEYGGTEKSSAVNYSKYKIMREGDDYSSAYDALHFRAVQFVGRASSTSPAVILKVQRWFAQSYHFQVREDGEGEAGEADAGDGKEGGVVVTYHGFKKLASHMARAAAEARDFHFTQQQQQQQQQPQQLTDGGARSLPRKKAPKGNGVGSQDASSTNRWKAERGFNDYMRGLRAVFPCARFVMNTREDVQRQARSGMLGHRNHGRGASLGQLTAENQMMRRWHDSVVASAEMNSEVSQSWWLELGAGGFRADQFTDLARWLGYRTCTFSAVAHANKLWYASDMRRVGVVCASSF